MAANGLRKELLGWLEHWYTCGKDKDLKGKWKVEGEYVYRHIVDIIKLYCLQPSPAERAKKAK